MNRQTTPEIAAGQSRRTDFTRLFAPGAIAVIGASADEDSISGQPIRYLREHGYGGRIYPVNPRYQTMASCALMRTSRPCPKFPMSC